MKKIQIVILWVLVCFCSYANAEQRRYKIELLVFSQDMPNTEVFNQTESQIDWPRGVSNRSTYNQVSPQYLTLKRSYAKLARSQNYRPLMHVGWFQSVHENKFGRAVKIRNPAGTINGFFRLQRGSLVHMIADIEYSPGHSVIYRLNEKRRFKLNETHYLDHPKFGMLVRVSPI